MSITDRDENIIGITLKYIGSPSREYLELHVYCNREMDLEWDEQFSKHTDSSGVGYFSITMNSKSGCSVIETDRFWFFLGDLKYLFAALGIVAGLLTCMGGRLFLTYVVFASIPCGVMVATNAILYLVYDGLDLDTFSYWIAFVASGVVGLLLAWLATKYAKAGPVILAAWTGFEIGVAFSNLLYFQMENIFIFWLIIGCFMLIVMMISVSNQNKHMLWVTAIFGSYLIMISLAVFVGRWPIDLNLPKLVYYGAVTRQEPYFYLYMSAWLFLSCIGMVMQCFILWYYKKTGKPLHPRLKEAVDAFDFGRTAEQIKWDKDHKKFLRAVENGCESTEGNDSIFLDMQSRRCGSDASGKPYRTGSRDVMRMLSQGSDGS